MIQSVFCESKDAIIAVSGTVIGTVLGWVLGKIDFGKLHIRLTDYTEEYCRVDPRTMSYPGKKPYELYYVELKFRICLYNSLSKNRAIRNCALEFLDDKRKCFYEVNVQDEDTRRSYGPGVKYDDISIVNVNGNESKNIHALVGVTEIDQLYKVKKIRFKYEDEKFHKKRIRYKTIDFSSIARVEPIPEEATED